MQTHRLRGRIAQLVAVELGGPRLVLQLGVADIAVVLAEKVKLETKRNLNLKVEIQFRTTEDIFVSSVI